MDSKIINLLRVPSTKEKRMLSSRGYIFVLWGDQFEALPAAIFVTELREVGLRVKLVSFERTRITGTHGLTLYPDVTLEQVLFLGHQAISIIIPCGPLGSKQLENDPRLYRFFRQAYESGAQFVIGQQLNTSYLADINLLPPEQDSVITYPDDSEDIVIFARQLAISLSPLAY